MAQMKIGITHRLFFAILAAAVFAVVAMFGIMQWSVDRGFLRYVNSLEQIRLARLTEQLEESYAQAGSWDFLRDAPMVWCRLVDSSLSEEGAQPDDLPPPPPHPPWEGRMRDHQPPQMMGRHFRQMPHGGGMRFEKRLLVLDREQNTVFGPENRPPDMELHPLHQDNMIIGYLGFVPRAHLTETHQLRFVREQKSVFALVAAVLVLMAAGLSLPLANRLVHPIKALSSATKRMAAGEYSSRVEVDTNDELGQLARDFNLMTLTLEKNEQARRQWVADISHELRTPLAILLAEIEALEDGVRPTTREAIHSLHGEVVRLSRLVDDLYQLSMSDLGALSYRKVTLDLAVLLTEVIAFYRQGFTEKNITLTVDIQATARAVVFGDPERLRQLFTNIFDNALNYTDCGGELVMTLRQETRGLTMDFEDTAPGVPEAEIGLVFDRLYRAEKSRTRNLGGAGLGLAICKNIVEAHAGTITAQASSLGGLWIRVTLPIAPESTLGKGI